MFDWLGGVVVRWPVAVIGFWVTLAAVLFVSLPSLTQVVRDNPVELLPGDAPSMVTARQMTEAFDESGSQNVLLVVLTNEQGLTPADEDVYRTLVDRLNPPDVVAVQNFLATPALREVMTSEDNKAWYLPVSIAGVLGSPDSAEAYSRVVETVKATAAGSTLTAYVTGPAATVGDLSAVGERDLHLIEIATALMVLTILLVVYRNPVTMLLPLLMIGVSLVVAQAVVAGLAHLGVLGVSSQTVVLMGGMLLGAGTDYAVFLISRYHEYRRAGVYSDQAVAKALASTAKVVTASAATVAITFLCMAFARLGVFSTVGPALAVSIGVGFLASITLLPAILVLAGRQGWISPRRELGTRFWRRSGVNIVRHPVKHLVASLMVLATLAGCATLVRYNYDDRKALPQSAESNIGYAAMDRHFSPNSTILQYILIRSPHDLRTPRALADLEQMAQRIRQLRDIELVRGITRPSGEPLEQARVSGQAGEVGHQLADASTQITNSTGDLDLLASGAQELADNLAAMRDGVSQSGLTTALAQLDALTQVLPQLGGLADDVRSALAGANNLAEASQRLADGVRTLVDQTKQMGEGLTGASAFLLAMKHDAAAPSMAGFYIPPQALSQVDFQGAAAVFVSPDGHAVRYLVQTRLDPFSTAAMDQVGSITDTARAAQPNTSLSDASISVAGFPAVNRDNRDYYNRDIKYITVVTVAVVLLILMSLLRAIVAPLYLIGSVIISYLSALGIGVIVFQLIGGQALAWSVPGMAFIVLVAVGADYNLLLISRIREESARGIRSGVVRTVGSTGAVITSAGVIFAASMFGLLFSSIGTMVQAGFIIGVGLLLDTFVVRTITVPALAVLAGRANWWPSHDLRKPG